LALRQAAKPRSPAMKAAKIEATSGSASIGWPFSA
jgi:hypothetical protein